MARSIGKRGLLVAGIVILAVGLSACGRRGPLEAPFAVAPVVPPAAQATG